MEPFLCEITKFLGGPLRKLFFSSNTLLFWSVLWQYIIIWVCTAAVHYYLGLYCGNTLLFGSVLRQYIIIWVCTAAKHYYFGMYCGNTLLFGSVLRQYISTESPLFSTRLVYRTTSSYMHSSLRPTQRNKNKSFRTLSDTPTCNGNEYLCSRCNNALYLFAQTQRSFIQYWIRLTQVLINVFLFKLQHRLSLDVSGLSIVREILPAKMLLGKKLTLSK